MSQVGIEYLGWAATAVFVASYFFARPSLLRGAQMFGAAILNPFVRPGPLKSGFGRDQKIGRIWMQRLGDETLGNHRPVRVGGVDEIDSQLDRAPQDGNRLGMVGRFSPDAGAGKLHRAIAESANGNVAAD